MYWVIILFLVVALVVSIGIAVKENIANSELSVQNNMLIARATKMAKECVTITEEYDSVSDELEKVTKECAAIRAELMDFRAKSKDALINAAKELREQGNTQAEIAKVLGISRSSVQRFLKM